MSQQFCLKWNSHMTNMMDVFKNLLSTESMVDCTLACDGLSLKAHKMVLSACSPFFQALFLENPCKHPIVILKDMKYTELKAIIEFMYHGEVNVGQDQLSALMKTAETLRVKGLAEVTNEKNSQSSVSGDEPSHRSVPRTETPPPSKRRRGRTRKRSLSDSNRSDDESNEPKVKQPMSPDIEELSGDHTMEATSGHFSSIQSQVPMQQMPSHSTNSFQRTNVSQESPHVEEPTSADESEFGVEPAKLLEQTLTTDDLANARRGRSSAQSSMEMQRRVRSTDHSSSLVPTSMPSDSYSSSMNQQLESPPDIKPELLDLDPPISPVPGPSHSADNSMMFDQSSVSSHPGTSFQDNSGALVPQDSSPQVHRRHNRPLDNIPAEVLPFLKLPGLSIQPAGRAEPPPPPKSTGVEIYPPLPPQVQHLHPSSSSSQPPPPQRSEAAAHRASASRYHCEFCPYETSSVQRLQLHLNTHQMSMTTSYPKQFKNPKQPRMHLTPPTTNPNQAIHRCVYCEKMYKTADSLNNHLKSHYLDARCNFCEKTFKNEVLLKRHMSSVHSMV